MRITEVKDGVFYATLVFGSGAEVSARPVRLDRAGAAHRQPDRVQPRRSSTRPGSRCPAEQEDEVEKFREFLDQVTPDDFDAH